MKRLIFGIVLIGLFQTTVAQAETQPRYKKTQEVKFEGSEVDGVARTPDGSYVVQKRGISFIPLYDVKNHLNENMGSSIEYLK